jgi:hypothetical protein
MKKNKEYNGHKNKSYWNPTVAMNWYQIALGWTCNDV